MIQLSLQNIEKSSGGKLFFPKESSPSLSSSLIVSSVVMDSRKVEKGSLFLAAKGERVDGHRFIVSAFEKGAYCVITEKSPDVVEEEHGISAEAWGPYIIVEDTFNALKEIAEFYRSGLSIPVIGISGSVGKTSTKEFIAAVLGTKYHVLRTEGNYNNEIGLPLTLLKIREEHEAAVIEMGISDFGEMRRLSKIAKPDICVLTNIGYSHLENLKSRDGILKAKTEMFEYMSPKGDVCLNGDDDKLRSIDNVNGRKPYFFGIRGSSSIKRGQDGGLPEVYVTDLKCRGLDGSDAVLHFKAHREAKETFWLKESISLKGKSITVGGRVSTDKAVKIHIPLPGEHMASNAAAAACVGRLMGLTPEQIVEGIARVKPVGGRSNFIQTSQYTLIDDCYNANPISMKAAIDLLKEMDAPRVAILGDMFELGEESDSMHDSMGAYTAKAGVSTIICIGENARNIYAGAMREASSGQTVLHFNNKQEFFRSWNEGKICLTEDSTILIKASHGMAFDEIVNMLVSKKPE